MLGRHYHHLHTLHQAAPQSTAAGTNGDGLQAAGLLEQLPSSRGPVHLGDAQVECGIPGLDTKTLSTFDALMGELEKTETMLRLDIYQAVAACLSLSVAEPSANGLSQVLSVAHDDQPRQGVSASNLLRKLRKLLVNDDVQVAQAADPKSGPVDPRAATVLGLRLCALLRVTGLFTPPRECALSKVLAEAVAQHYRHAFRFPEHQITHDVFSGTGRPGITHAVRRALARAYRSSDGFRAFSAFPPVIYAVQGEMLEAAREALSEVLILGMAELVSLRDVPCCPDSEIMSLIALKAACDEDVAAGRTPLMVIGRVGTPVTAQVDDINGMRLISDLCKMWLHLEGDAAFLITSTTKHAAAALSPIEQADSVSLDNCRLTKAPRYLCTTFVKVTPTDLPMPLPHWSATLPLWFSMQALGEPGEVDWGGMYVEKVVSFKEHICGIPGIIIHERHDGTPHVVMFRYSMPETEDERNEKRGDKSLNLQESTTIENRITRYLAWAAASRGWPLELVALDGTAYVRFSPWMSGRATNVGFAIITATFRREIELVQSNLDFSDAFRRTMETVGMAVVVGSRKIDDGLATAGDTDSIFGLGCVRYVPSYVSPEHVSGVEDDLDALNASLVEYLREEHDACLFSQGVTPEGRTCVFIGVDRSPMTEDHIRILADVVSTSAGQVERSSQFMATIAGVIRRGISEAEQELQRSSNRAMREEGIVRQIPLVGSVYNWLSPRQPSCRELKGKAFCISTGRLSDPPPPMLSPRSELSNLEAS